MKVKLLSIDDDCVSCVVASLKRFHSLDSHMEEAICICFGWKPTKQIPLKLKLINVHLASSAWMYFKIALRRSQKKISLRGPRIDVT